MRMFLKAASVFPLRRHLMMLVVAAIVPVLVFATIMVIVFGRGERASTERGLRDTTRALTLAVDREIETSMKALGAPTIEIVVPVIRNDRLRYGLAADLEPAALSGFLASQSLPSDWNGTIIDRDGFVVARSRLPETWLGPPAR